MSKITLSFMQRFMGELDTAIRNFVGGITGDLSELETTDKTSLVDAINEVKTGSSVVTSLAGLDDVLVTTPSNGQVLKYNVTEHKWENANESGGGGSATYMSQTLSAGSTSVTFTGVPTTGNLALDIYTSKAGLDYTSLDDSTAGTLIVTYEAQSSAVTVYLRIEVIS